MTYSYSTDEEHFTGDYESAEEAAQAAFYDDPDIESIYVGEARKMTAHDFVSGHSILELINEAACDDGPESADDWLYDGLAKDKGKCAELEKIIGDWIELHAPVKFFTVDNIVTVHREDVK